MAGLVSPSQQSWKTSALWSAQVVIALIFLAAGGAKFLGLNHMVALFDQIGAGQWFRYVTGGLEILGAALLLSPGLAAFGALLLACVMVGAVATHLFFGGSLIAASMLFAACVLIALASRSDAPH